MLAPMVAAQGFPLLECAMSVEDVAIFKPHPKAYALACERLACRRRRSRLSAPMAGMRQGPRHSASRVAWLNRRGEPEDRLPARPAAQIASLAELPALFGIGADERARDR